MLFKAIIRDPLLFLLRIALVLGLVYLAGAFQVLHAADPPTSPVEVPQGWQRLGPYGGKVVDVAYAPSDPNIVYALLNNETVPVYKSTDNGKTWNFLSVPFHMSIPRNIVVSPVNPDIVIFCDSSSTLRSSDGGLTWSQNEDTDFKLIKFSRANPEKVYGTSGSLFRSMDSGFTWDVVTTDHYIGKFTLDPFNENRLLATTSEGPNDHGLYESTDDGVTWNLIGFDGEVIRSIEFGRTPGTIYLVKYYDAAIWKSSDNGTTWSILTDSFASDILDFDVTGTTTEELFVTIEDYGAAFESNIWKSNDGGVTWANVPSRWAYLLYDKVAIDPSNSNRFIGYQKWFGMHFTWDAGATWTQSGSEFPGIALQHIGVSPVREGLIHVQTKDGYNLCSLDSGLTWEFTHFKNEFSLGFGFAFSMNNDQCVYWISGDSIISGCKLHKSQNGGLDWQDITPAGFIWVSSIAVHPNNDSVLLCGSQRGVLIQSVDSGQNWTEVYNASDSAVFILFIRFKPLDPTVVYAGTYNSNTSEVKLLKSTDSGATWVEVSRIPTIYLRDLAVSHTEPEVIYVSDGSRLLRSKDQGANWDLPGAYRSIDSDRCLTSFHHGSWVWSLGYIVFWFSGDYGETWRNVPMPSVYGESFGEEANMWMSDSSFFVATRYDGLWTHVDDMPPVIMMAGSNYDAEASMLHFNAWVSDVKGPGDIDTVEILYEGNELGVRLYDDGTHGDSSAHDGLFSLSIPADVTDPIINVPYSLIAKDKNGLVSRGWPELTTTEKRGEQPQ